MSTFLLNWKWAVCSPLSVIYRAIEMTATIIIINNVVVAVVMVGGGGGITVAVYGYLSADIIEVGILPPAMIISQFR